MGSPRFINPIYAPISDVDRDLTELIFSGLMKYNSEAKIDLDLAKEYRILEEGEIYEFYLRDKIFWQDGQPLTVDDVIFTVQTIQNPKIKSPLRSSWLGVEVEKISDNALRFKLKNASAIFLENCTLKIIPKHIWENISPENFALTPLNLNPVGSGPYRLEKINPDKGGEITSLDLVKNPLYYASGPNILKITFKFFDSEEQLVLAYKRGEIKGFAPLSSSIQKDKTANLYSFLLPRYFAVFFNQKDSKVFSEKNVRLALNYGTNKEEILETLFSGQGQVVHSPILPNIYGFKEPSETYPFNIDKAKEILETSGFLMTEEGLRVKIVKKELAFTFQKNLSFGSRGDDVRELQKCLANPTIGGSEIYPEGEITGYFGQKTKAAVIRFQEKYSQDILEPFNLTKGTGEVKSKTREKLNKVCFEEPEERIPLKFSLYTVDQPLLAEVANILKNQWEQLGVEVTIELFDINTLEREVLRKRRFEALLFGEVLGLIPDPFPFWHSSQKGELGLNLTNYDNEISDQLLKVNRQTLDEKEREEKLEEFQDVLIEDAPVIFLYSPDYLYFVSKEIKGIEEKIIVDPSKRFVNIREWYMETKRVLK